MNLLQRILSTDLAPHGYCFLWLPEILWLHVASDALIALAYLAIPPALLTFAWRRRELPYPWLLAMFAAFITLCGLTHLMAIWTVWRPDYGAEGLLKAATALVSLATAATLIPVMPKMLALRGPRELEAANLRLARARGELEAEVLERTAALRESEERLRLAVEATGLGIWDVDPRTGARRWSPEYKAILGLPADAAPGAELFASLIHPDDRARVVERYRDSYGPAGDGSYEAEHRILRADDGAERWVQVTGRVHFDGAGRAVRGIGTLADVTERRRIGAALRESEERYRALVETAPDAVLAHRGGTIILANRQAAALFGAGAADELVGRCVFDLVDPESLELARGRTARAMAPGARLEPAELTYRRLDGTPFPVEVAAAGVLVEGRLAIQVVIRDIGTRKAAERHQWLLLQELAHRVKNTLAVVQSIAARSLAGGRDLAEAREVFTRRLRALANAHTLLTAGEWQGASLKAVVEAELTPYERRAEIAGGEVRLTAKETITLSLVLHELATNAAKHGSLSVPEGRVSVGWELAAGPGGTALRLAWRERGGPLVAPPARRGFGRTLVEQAVAYDLQGRARLDFAPEGVSYELEAALGAAA